jgi:hypothetical protein
VTGKFCDDANKGGIDVCGGFRLRRDVSEIEEGVVDVRPSDDCTSQNIRVRCTAAEPVDIALATANMAGVDMNRHNGGASVVNLERWLLAKSRHVRSPQGVLA